MSIEREAIDLVRVNTSIPGAKRLLDAVEHVRSECEDSLAYLLSNRTRWEFAGRFFKDASLPPTSEFHVDDRPLADALTDSR